MKRGISATDPEDSHTPNASATPDAPPTVTKPLDDTTTTTNVLDDVSKVKNDVIDENAYKSNEPAKKKVKENETETDNDSEETRVSVLDSELEKTISLLHTTTEIAKEEIKLVEKKKEDEEKGKKEENKQNNNNSEKKKNNAKVNNKNKKVIDDEDSDDEDENKEKDTTTSSDDDDNTETDTSSDDDDTETDTSEEEEDKDDDSEDFEEDSSEQDSSDDSDDSDDSDSPSRKRKKKVTTRSSSSSKTSKTSTPTKRTTRSSSSNSSNNTKNSKNTNKSKTSTKQSNNNNNKNSGNNKRGRKKEKMVYDTSDESEDYSPDDSSDDSADEFIYSTSGSTKNTKSHSMLPKGRVCYACNKRLDLIHCTSCDNSFHLKCLTETHKTYYRKCIKDNFPWTCPLCRGLEVPKIRLCSRCLKEVYPSATSLTCAHCKEVFHEGCTKHKDSMPPSMVYSMNLWKKSDLEWHCEDCAPHICEVCHKKTTRELQCSSCNLYFHEICADFHGKYNFVCKLCSSGRVVTKILTYRRVDDSDPSTRRKRRMVQQQQQQQPSSSSSTSSSQKQESSETQDVSVKKEENETKKDENEQVKEEENDTVKKEESEQTKKDETVKNENDSVKEEKNEPNKKKSIVPDELEYFVKWKDESHIHDEWVNERWLYQTAKSHFSFYQHKHLTQTGEDPEYDAVMENVNSLWTQVDRIVDHDKIGRGKMQYLVKWKGLGYEECEWEEDTFLKDFKKDIDDYYARNDYNAVMKARGHKKSGETRNGKGHFKELKTNPSCLPLKLYDYQLEGVNWLLYSWHKGNNTILADEMGLGKTITTIAFFSVLKHNLGEHGPYVVIVPLSTIPNWEREFRTWAPDFNVVTFLGNEYARKTIVENEFWFEGHENSSQTKFNVLLTTYDMMVFASQALRKIVWTQLVVDEGHRLKNRKSRLFENLEGFKTHSRMLLTGTPIQNDLEELFNLLSFLQVEGFDDPEHLYTTQFESLEEKEVIEKLHSLIRPHMLRRLKEDVFKDLPEKEEYLVPVDLTALQKKYYRAVLTHDYALLRAAERTKTKTASTKLLQTLSALQKVCNHPYLIEGTEPVGLPPEEEFSRMVGASGKLDLTMRMLIKLFAQGHKVLIFSQMTTMLDIIDDCVNYKGWVYGRIDGSTPSIERQRVIDEFNRPGSKMSVLLLSTKAGGLGINLATADTVIIYDSDWNPHNDAQALSRAHRIGQKNKVMVYQLVSRHTVEEKIIERARSKLLLEHLVVQKMKDEFKKGELDELLKYGAKHLFDDEEEENKSADAAATAAKSGDGASSTPSSGSISSSTSSEHVNTYTDAELDKLLDRNRGLDEKTLAEQKEAAEAKLAADNKYFGGFKTARVWVTEEEEENGGQGAEDSGSPKEGENDDDFWENLLKSRYLALQEAEAKELENTVRSTRLKRVSYAEIEPKRKRGRHSSKTPDGFDSSSSDDSSDEDGSGEEGDDDFIDDGIMFDDDDDDDMDDENMINDDLYDEDYGSSKQKNKKMVNPQPVTLAQSMGKVGRPKKLSSKTPTSKKSAKKMANTPPVFGPTIRQVQFATGASALAQHMAHQQQLLLQQQQQQGGVIPPLSAIFTPASTHKFKTPVVNAYPNYTTLAARQNDQAIMSINNIIIQSANNLNAKADQFKQYSFKAPASSVPAAVATATPAAAAAAAAAAANGTSVIGASNNANVNQTALLVRYQKFQSEKVLGDKCMAGNNFLKAAEHYTIAHKTYPEENSILYFRARAFTAEGNFLEALNDLIELVKKHKEHADAYVLMIHIYACAGPAYELQMHNVLNYMLKTIPSNVSAITKARETISRASELHNIHLVRQKQLHLIKMKEREAENNRNNQMNMNSVKQGNNGVAATADAAGVAVGSSTSTPAAAAAAVPAVATPKVKIVLDNDSSLKIAQRVQQIRENSVAQAQAQAQPPKTVSPTSKTTKTISTSELLSIINRAPNPSAISSNNVINNNNNNNKTQQPKSQPPQNASLNNQNLQRDQLPPNVTVEEFVGMFGNTKTITKKTFIEACAKAGFVKRSYPPVPDGVLKATIDNDRSVAKMNESLALARKGERMGAFSCASEAIELDNHNPVAYINYAMFLAMNKALSEALENCKISIFLDKSVNAYNLLTSILIHFNKPKDAIEYGLLNAVELFKDDVLVNEVGSTATSVLDYYKKSLNK